MKLSETLRLSEGIAPLIGHMYTTFDSEGNLTGACYLGGIAYSLGYRGEGTRKLYALLDEYWPWAKDFIVRSCPVCNTYVNSNLFTVISGELGCVGSSCYGKLTRSQLADWVATIEPQDEPVEEVSHEHITKNWRISNPWSKLETEG